MEQIRSETEMLELMTEMADKINELDIASLNQAIADLSAVVKPLADFFGKFR